MNVKLVLLDSSKHETVRYSLFFLYINLVLSIGKAKLLDNDFSPNAWK